MTITTETSLGTGLEARGVHAWFGKHHALADITLDFPAGTVTALIGPSGCGKSTFLRTLNRMHEFIPGAAMAGEVRLDGRDIYQSFFSLFLWFVLLFSLHVELMLGFGHINAHANTCFFLLGSAVLVVLCNFNLSI